MAKQVAEKDFRRIKAAQKSGRAVEQVVKQLGWSERTIRRAFKVNTFVGFKRQIAKDTAAIRAARKANKTKRVIRKGTFKHSNEAGQYIATPVGKPAVNLSRPGFFKRLLSRVQ